ncbi:uncharacterized protein LOC142616952 [Castanea sativa]|uniref:uncharacterized protein LOC142616952 n=1 Tax=Castanea sativa TaxID=21020 RepID=UPI003F64AB4C
MTIFSQISIHFYKIISSIRFLSLLMDFHYDIDFIFPNDKPPFDSSFNDDELELTLAIAIEELNNEGASTSRHRLVQPRKFILRNPLQGHDRLFHDYFAETPVYPPTVFRRRFRMSCSLFLRIHSRVEATEPYFVQKRNAANTIGLSSFQKMTAAIRMLAYGVSADFLDEYLRIGETTAIKSLKFFVKVVVSIFFEEYLRSPNNNDIARLLAIGQHRGFLGMMGSIDCMHWKWKNCPRSHNDINVLEQSFVFSELAEGCAPPVNYSINGSDYSMGYYLANGIYPSWATFVKTIPAPKDRKRQHFASAQEAARKDVERAFGVLQVRFVIVHKPSHFFHLETLKDIMMACIILHNMMVEDERHTYLGANDYDYDQIDDNGLESVSHTPTCNLMQFIERHNSIRDRGIHSQLQANLV